MNAEPVRRRHAQQARQLRVRAGERAREAERFFLHPFGVGHHGRTFVGQHETVACTLKERVADRFFERAQPPAHGRLRLPDEPRRCAQRAAPGDRQKNPDVAPVHVLVIHFCLEGVQ